jgi:hypothetical protein
MAEALRIPPQVWAPHAFAIGLTDRFDRLVRPTGGRSGGRAPAGAQLFLVLC